MRCETRRENDRGGDGSTDFVREVAKDEHADDGSGESGGSQSGTIVVFAEPCSVDSFQHWTVGLSWPLRNDLARWELTGVDWGRGKRSDDSFPERTTTNLPHPMTLLACPTTNPHLSPNH